MTRRWLDSMVTWWALSMIAFGLLLIAGQTS